MVQVLESWGKDLGSGIGQGISSAMQFAAKMKMKKKEQEDLKKLYDDIEGKSGGGEADNSTSKNQARQLQGNAVDPKQIQQKFLESLPMFEQMKGSELTPQDADAIWKNMFEPNLQQNQQAQQGDPQQQMQQPEQNRLQEQDPFIKSKKALIAVDHVLKWV